MYQENNTKRIKELGINKNELEFVSSYSPLIIGEMTESEIEDIIVSYNVESVDLYEEADVVVNSTSSGTYYPFYTTWKSAINVDYTTETLGLKGEGVTVGVYDAGRVERLSEFNNSDITELNLTSEYSDHATDITRILAGSNGVVPGAKTYVNSQKTSRYSSIEELIDAGVCLITINVGNSREDDFYTYYEKWIDYIAYTQNVIFTFATGNTGVDTNIGVPALSYNSITVGGINTKDTTIKTDDAISNYTAGLNNGNNACAKPDVMAPSEYVFIGGYVGTSYANPMVAGICAQIIQTKPTLAFQPDTVKAIILASCDRKCAESYTAGLTEKEGSGVVNAQRAIEIVSSSRHARFPSTVGGMGFILGNGSDYRKCVLTWLVPATTVNNIEIPNYKFELGEMNGNNYIGTNLPNSSAEVIVTDAFKANLGSGYNYMRYSFSSVNGIKSTYLSLAWYDL